MENHVIRTDNLVKKYKSRTVVNEVSINFTQGEIVGLLGPNGAGKTTSFYMIVGLIKPYSGRIFLDDKDISEEPMYKRAQMGIAYLPQEAFSLREALDSFTVRGAEASFEENFKGRIAPGFAADFTVLEENPFEKAAQALHRIKVSACFLGGRKC